MTRRKEAPSHRLQTSNSWNTFRSRAERSYLTITEGGILFACDRKWHHNSPNELNYFTLTFLRGLQPQEKLQNWFWLYLLRVLDHSGVNNVEPTIKKKDQKENSDYNKHFSKTVTLPDKRVRILSQVWFSFSSIVPALSVGTAGVCWRLKSRINLEHVKEDRKRHQWWVNSRKWSWCPQFIYQLITEHNWKVCLSEPDRHHAQVK